MIRVKTEQLRLQAAIRGWDQRLLARAAGISEATVSRALAGRCVRRKTLLQLARALSSQRPVRELEDLLAPGSDAA